ncbi:Rib/alpha-like domain-containing protein [Gardnerella vaginalis]|uniref:Long Rib domain-containing protein n=1 Tax=Gardnerella swidsinskii TaxID=2792979 RepID=A0ABM6GK60_9BIFI|nr:hypothetical protein BVL65_05515 [Gardnerella vaginalis]
MNRHHALDDVSGSVTLQKSKGCTKGCSIANASKLYYIRRAALALIVAVATILAVLVVPAKPASAAQVMWSYGGYGYFTANGNGIGNAVENMHITPTITKDSNGTHVQYEIYFNYAFLERLDSQPRQRIPARPTFYVDLPKQLITDTIRVKRDRRNVYEKKWNDWSTQNASGIPETMKTWDKKWGWSQTISRWHYTYGNTDFNDQWEDTVGDGHFGCGYNVDSESKFKNYSLCEIKKWHDNGDFGIMLRSFESANSTTCYRWVITADVPDGTDIRYMPIIAGYQATNAESHERDYAAYGPYDHDGDGIPDNVEWDNSTNPTKPGGLHFEESEDSQPRQASSVRAYTDDGHWQENPGDYFNNKGSFVPDYGSDGKRGKLYDHIPKNLTYSIDGNAYFDNNKGSNAQVTFDDPNKQKPEPLQQGHAWIDKSTGKVYFNPADSHKNHTVYIPIKVTYPNPNKYNCNHPQPFSETVVAKFKVWPMSHFYKPVYPDYDKKQVQAGKSITSVPENKGITKGDFPKGTRFELGKSNKYSKPVLSWSKMTNTSTGEVTFTPSKPQDPNNYDTPVIAHYPDGSSSTDNGQVYAHVKVTPLTVGNNDLGFSIAEGAGMHDYGSNYSDRITYGSYHTDHYTNLDKDKQIDSSRLLIPDAWSANNKSPIKFRAICHEENKDNYTLLKWDEVKNKPFGEVNGLKFTAFRQWKIATEDEENKCRNDKNCNLNDFKYSHLTKDEYNMNTMARSRAIITGTPKKSGKYECRVFAFNNAVSLKNFDDIIVNDTGGSVVYKKMLFANYGTQGDTKNSKGKDWNDQTLKFSVKASYAHRNNPSYVPLKVKAGEYHASLTNGYKNMTDVPTSKKGANNATHQDDIEEGALPDGTWFEFDEKQYKKDNPGWYKKDKDHPYGMSFYDNGQDNKPSDGGKTGKNHGTGDGSHYGVMSFKPLKWQKPGVYKIPVIVHYPDGSKSTDKDAGNGDGVSKPNPVYAQVTADPMEGDDIKLRVLRSDSPDAPDISDADGQFGSGSGLTIMSGMSLMHRPFIDAWSTKDVWNSGNKTEKKIGLEVLCENDDRDFVSKLAGMKASNPITWSHVDMYSEREKCKNNSNCNAQHKLYSYNANDNPNNPFDAAQRTTATLDGIPEKTGDYQCVAWALKPDAKKSFDDMSSHHGAKYDLLHDVHGDQYTRGKDYEFKTFMIHVVKPFSLPKTGGCGWNASLCVVSAMLSSLIAAVFVMDQTKRGHELLGRWRLV